MPNEQNIAVIEPSFSGDLAAVTRAFERLGMRVMTRAEFDKRPRYGSRTGDLDDAQIGELA